MTSLDQFIDFCQKLQPQEKKDIQRFFEGVVFFPYDNELLLQAFLFLNIDDIFPFCTDLLLFEKSPKGKETDQGKCDFVYLTKANQIALIETKFIDTEKAGSTGRKRRSHHRNKVFDQVITLRKKFSEVWSIETDLINCCIFTTDELNYRDEADNVDTKHVPIKKLMQWQHELKGVLQMKYGMH